MLRRLLLFTVLSILTLSNIQAQITISESINVDGLNRSHRLHIPPAGGSTSLLPLVINMHGFLGDAGLQEWYSGMNDIADTANFFVVYPNGTEILFIFQGWYMELAGTPVDDVSYLSFLIDYLVANYNIDPNRVFATGYSMGGGMAVSLACAIPEKVKAIAPVAGYVPKINGTLCNPAVPVSLIQFHGTSDPDVPYNGTSYLAPAPLVYKAFTRIGNCASAPAVTNLPDLDTADGSTVTRVTIDNCGGSQSDYHFYRINSGGHTWPGGIDGSRDINASLLMWEFFRELDPSPRISIASEPEIVPFGEQVRIWPTVTKGSINLSTVIEIDQVEIYKSDGSRIHTAKLNGRSANIDLGNHPEGLYIVKILSTSGLASSHRVILVN